MSRPREQIQDPGDPLHELQASDRQFQLLVDSVEDYAIFAAREVAEEYTPQALAKGLTMDIRLPERLPVIQSDPSRVRQILGNLISNAVKYTSHGGIVVEVALRTDRPTGSCVAIDVADTGPGIPASARHLLFREFSRIHEGTAEGSGLGLAISQRIARALGGSIELSSEEGRGATFTLLLPTERSLD